MLHSEFVRAVKLLGGTVITCRPERLPDLPNVGKAYTCGCGETRLARLPDGTLICATCDHADEAPKIVEASRA